MISNIEVRYSLVNDFILSISRIIHNDSLASFVSTYDRDLADRVKIDETLTKWVKKTLEKIPEDKKKLMDFYGNKQTAFRMVLLHLNSKNNFIDIGSFFHALQNIDSSQLINEYFSLLFNLFEIELPKPIDELDSSEFMNIVNETEFEANRKWELLQMYNNPQQTLDNLIHLLEWYYENHFKRLEKKLTKIGDRYTKIIRQKLNSYGEEYLLLLTGRDYQKNKDESKKIIIEISYFLELVSIFYERFDCNEDIYYIGFRYNEVFVERKHRVMSNVHLFKALADETRQNMIRLLSERDYYADEFAKAINIANSTVSYHLSILMLEGIITTARLNKKTYFSLKKNKLKKALNQAMQRMLIGEEND